MLYNEARNLLVKQLLRSVQDYFGGYTEHPDYETLIKTGKVSTVPASDYCGTERKGLYLPVWDHSAIAEHFDLL